MPKARTPFPPEIRTMLARAMYKRGMAWAFIDVAIRKWEAGQGMQDAKCTEEAKGKEYGLETGCKCEGCSLRSCFAFLDQAKNLLALQ